MKKVRYVFVGLFIVILFVFFGFTISSNKKISDVEKRELVTFPDIEFSSFFKDQFYTTLTSAFNDQLLLRNFLVKGYFLFQFQRYLGDVVVGEDNEMFSAVQSSKNLDSYKKGLISDSKLINEVASGIDAKFVFLSIPRKDAVMKEYLPSTYTSSDEIYKYGVSVLKENLGSDISFIDAYDVFMNNKILDYNFYFKNDHHINVRGGYLLYKEIANLSGINSYNLEDEFSVVKTYVNGSFNKQIGQSVKPSYEELYLVPKKNLDYYRYEDDKLSDSPVWGKGTSYEDSFMDGDKAYTRIETKRDNLPNILFVGSSFTNILEALSVPSYNRVVSIDYRHNKTGNSISYYVEKYDIDYVVFIPAQSNDALSVNQIKLHLGFAN